MSKSRSHFMTNLQMRVAFLGVSEVATGEGSVAAATLMSGLPLMAAQNAKRQKGVS